LEQLSDSTKPTFQNLECYSKKSKFGSLLELIARYKSEKYISINLKKERKMVFDLGLLTACISIMSCNYDQVKYVNDFSPFKSASEFQLGSPGVEP